MRRGFGRVMDHQTIVRILREGDDLYREARAGRDAASPPADRGLTSTAA
jgi:hypothetical protein